MYAPIVVVKQLSTLCLVQWEQALCHRKDYLSGVRKSCGSCYSGHMCGDTAFPVTDKLILNNFTLTRSNIYGVLWHVCCLKVNCVRQHCLTVGVFHNRAVSARYARETSAAIFELRPLRLHNASSMYTQVTPRQLFVPSARKVKS